MVTGVHLAEKLLQATSHERTTRSTSLSLEATNLKLFWGELPPSQDLLIQGWHCDSWCTSHMMKSLDAKHEESTSKIRLQPLLNFCWVPPCSYCFLFLPFLMANSHNRPSHRRLHQVVPIFGTASHLEESGWTSIDSVSIGSPKSRS